MFKLLKFKHKSSYFAYLAVAQLLKFGLRVAENLTTNLGVGSSPVRIELRTCLLLKSQYNFCCPSYSMVRFGRSTRANLLQLPKNP
jgi:hypothetical protein